MKKLVICLLALVLGFIAVGNAQNKQPQPSPEEIQKQIDTTFDMMTPMMSRMVEVMIEAQLTVLAKSESAEKIARYVKNLYEALMKQGFSKDEALKIATSLPLPSIPSASMSPK